MVNKGRVSAISNELEFSVRSRGSCGADEIIRKGAESGISVSKEVNPKSVVELNISKKIGVRELNESVGIDVRRISEIAEGLNCSIYGGSAVHESIGGLEPRAYRTTLLSKSLGIGMMQIVSQQVVIGANSEEFGFRLYNNFRKINPALLALSASSPHLYGETGSTHSSRRMQHYEDMFVHLPSVMYRHEGRMDSMDEYKKNLQRTSDIVNRLFWQRRIDSDFYRISHDGAFFPFATLAPHQVYNPTRIRPDHNDQSAGGDSFMSIELRVCDMPTTTFRMKTINSLAVGIAYYLQRNEAVDLPHGLNGNFELLKHVGRQGFDAKIGGIGLLDIGTNLAKVASEGLFYQGYIEEAKNIIDEVRHISGENDSVLISKRGGGPGDVDYLIGRLRKGE